MKQILLIFSILCFMLTGCNKAEPETIVDVDVDFFINMVEFLTPSGNTLTFEVETKNDQNCAGSEIEFSFRRESQALSLSLLDINSPEDCIEEPAPATASIFLGDLAYQPYTFKLDLRGEVESQGVLNVLNDRYVVSFQEMNGFEFIHKELMRVPDNMIWGYVNHGSVGEDAALSFVHELNEMAEEINLTDGYYGWFDVRGAELNTVKNEPQNRSNTRFAFIYEGNDIYLENLIATYRMNSEENVFALMNSKGKSF